MLDKMYELNKPILRKSLDVHSGRSENWQKCQTQLAQLIEKGKQTNLSRGQAANDLAALCDRFEKNCTIWN